LDNPPAGGLGNDTKEKMPKVDLIKKQHAYFLKGSK